MYLFPQLSYTTLSGSRGFVSGERSEETKKEGHRMLAENAVVKKKGRDNWIIRENEYSSKGRKSRGQKKKDTRSTNFIKRETGQPGDKCIFCKSVYRARLDPTQEGICDAGGVKPIIR